MQHESSSRVEKLAATLQLGAPTAIYQRVLSPSARRRMYVGLALASVCMLFFPSYVFIGSLLSTPRQPLLIMLGTVFFASFSMFTLLLVVVVVRRMTRPWCVVLYREGFITARGRRIETTRWDQVTAIRSVPSVAVILSLTGGRKRTFDRMFLPLEASHHLDPRSRDLPVFESSGLEEAKATAAVDRWEVAHGKETELIWSIEREIVLHLYPRILGTYQQGLPVPFGHVQLSTRGIQTGKTELPWSEVEQITLRGEAGDNPTPLPSAASHTMIERLAWWQTEVSMSDTILIIGKGQRRVVWSKSVTTVPNAYLMLELAGSVLSDLPHSTIRGTTSVQTE